MRLTSCIALALSRTISDLIALEEMSLLSLESIRERDSLLYAKLRTLIEELERKCLMLGMVRTATPELLEESE